MCRSRLCCSVLLLVITVHQGNSSVNLALRKPANQSGTYHENTSADKAVDGDARAWLTLNVNNPCSHTQQNVNNTAWWMVDLENIYRINSIYIIYRRNFRNRMAGYYVFISNNTDFMSGHLCYHHNDIVIPRRHEKSIVCQERGQYVTFYNNRSQSSPSAFSRIAYIELCEVRVWGCEIDKYGYGDCDRSCNCLKSGCNPATGFCDIPICPKGKRGPTCNTACEHNTYGYNCSNQCNCKHSSCNASSGICENSVCKPGFKGAMCSEACEENRFGDNCLYTCNCARGTCEAATGICKTPGCKSGYQGLSCSQASLSRIADRLAIPSIVLTILCVILLVTGVIFITLAQFLKEDKGIKLKGGILNILYRSKTEDSDNAKITEHVSGVRYENSEDVHVTGDKAPIWNISKK